MCGGMVLFVLLDLMWKRKCVVLLFVCGSLVIMLVVMMFLFFYVGLSVMVMCCCVC